MHTIHVYIFIHFSDGKNQTFWCSYYLLHWSEDTQFMVICKKGYIKITPQLTSLNVSHFSAFGLQMTTIALFTAKPCKVQGKRQCCLTVATMKQSKSLHMHPFGIGGKWKQLCLVAASGMKSYLRLEKSGQSQQRHIRDKLWRAWPFNTPNYKRRKGLSSSLVVRCSKE